jgi:hypothetical protein
MDGLQVQYAEQTAALTRLRASLTASVVVSTARGVEKDLPLSQVVRAYRPNLMSVPAKLAFYGGKVWEFIADDPREANTEGGVFPAIFGTVMMVLIMSFAVTPLGVIAAFYLREYAKQGPFVSVVRIAVPACPRLCSGCSESGSSSILWGGRSIASSFRKPSPRRPSAPAAFSGRP